MASRTNKPGPSAKESDPRVDSRVKIETPNRDSEASPRVRTAGIRHDNTNPGPKMKAGGPKAAGVRNDNTNPEPKLKAAAPKASTPKASTPKAAVVKGSCSVGEKPSPLIPKRNMYVYKPSPMTTNIQQILGPKPWLVELPETKYATHRLVSALSFADSINAWDDKCEDALRSCLPIREHHKAFLSHTMYVTMIGALVARALEQATYHTKKPLDLLADRYYVRSIATHDSSKTSRTEALAYSGIIAVHMDSERGGGRKWTPSELCDTGAVLRDFADIGFVHHYGANPHHPEYYKGEQMDDISLVEAIVDGLACIFERNKNHTDVHSWLAMYHIKRFDGPNAELAKRIMNALMAHITETDYNVLTTFRNSISLLIGESQPWSQICCTPDRVVPNPTSVPNHTYTQCFK